MTIFSFFGLLLPGILGTLYFLGVPLSQVKKTNRKIAHFIVSIALTGVFGRDLLSYNVLLNWRRQIPRGWISNHWCFNECIAAHWWHHKNCRNKLLANTVSCILFIFLSFSSTYIIMKAYYLLLEQKSFHHFVGPYYAICINTLSLHLCYGYYELPVL